MTCLYKQALQQAGPGIVAANDKAPFMAIDKLRVVFGKEVPAAAQMPVQRPPYVSQRYSQATP